MSEVRGILWAVIPQWETVPVERVYEEGSPHHVTLQFNALKKDWEKYIGKTLKVHVYEDCHNDRIQALRVRLPWFSIPCQNSNPHITVSYREGVEPKESNDMLLSPSVREKVAFDLLLEVEFYEFKEEV